MKHGSRIKEEIRKAVIDGDIGENEAQQIMDVLEKLEEEVKTKAKIPKNLINIQEINSVIAVGPKEIKKVNMKMKRINLGLRLI